RIPRAFTRIAEGVVTVPLRPKVALKFGSVGGLLVVSVPPSTDAAKAGLLPGDVIESIDGRPVYAGTYSAVLPKAPGARSSCVVVRNKEKITLTFEYSTHHDSPKP
ncbi:MAG TPA: PDZ domain-containing protein, partial [Pyrinomonadaceae bacterium]